MHKESSAITRYGYICQGIPVDWVDSFRITPAFVAVAFDIVSTMHLSPAHQTMNWDRLSSSFFYDQAGPYMVLQSHLFGLCVLIGVCFMTCWDMLAGLKNECWYDGLVWVETLWSTAWCISRNAMIARIACFRGGLGSAGGLDCRVADAQWDSVPGWYGGYAGCEGSSNSYFLNGTVFVKYDHSLANVITYFGVEFSNFGFAL